MVQGKIARMYYPGHRTASLCFLLSLCSVPTVYAEPEQFIELVEVTASSAEIPAGGSIEAELFYDAQQIEALGASTLEELLDELAPDVASVRGRHSGKPVVLVNGRRIASFLEIRRYPPEAVESIEVFPEEVALRHGYRADQKVVNIRLRPRFRATTVRGNAQASSENGGEAAEINADYLRLRLDQRLSVDLRTENQNEILEADRSVPFRARGKPFSLAGNLRSVGGGELDAALSALAGELVTDTTLPDAAGAGPLALDALLANANNPLRTDTQAYRSLAPERQNFSSGISYSQPLGERLLATVSGGYEQSEETSYLGLPRYTTIVRGVSPFSPFQNAVELNRFNQAGGPLQRDQSSDAYRLNGSLAATHDGWTWSWITNLALTQRTTKTDRNNLTLNTLPAGTNPFGDLAGFLQRQTDRQDSETRDYETRVLVNGALGDLPHGPISVALSGAFTRNEQRNTTSNPVVGVDSRLTRNLAQVRASVDAPLLDAAKFGELFANVNAEVSHYSDFDQITVVGAGLNWKPTKALQFLLSYTEEEGAPGIRELGDPLLLTPNQNVYDFVNDESVSVTRVSGGNSELEPDKREIWRLGARLRPLEAHNLQLSVDWIDRATDQPVGRFPAPSQEIEAVFPERFLRDGSGNLFAFDTRPINLHSERTNQLVSALRYTRAAAKGGRKGVKARGHKRGAGKGRISFSLGHTWTLRDELVIAPGLDAIDYVGHSTNGRGRGGAEHEVTARLGYYYNRLGFRMSAKWEDAISTVPNADGSSDLRQADLYTVNLAAFYLFTKKSPLAQRYGFLSGVRLRLRVNNVFNDKPNVRDQDGVVPAGGSGDELDPYGRTLQLEVRKMFRS